MSDKLAINCTTGKITEISFIGEELLSRQNDVILNSLVPPPEDITKAEREIETITLLIDLGVIV